MIPFFSLCVYVVQTHAYSLSLILVVSLIVFFLSLNNTVIINVSFRLFLALSLKGVHFHFIMLNYLIWLAFCLSCTNAYDFSSLFVLPIHYVGCRCVCVCMLFSFHIFVVYLFFIVSFVVFLLCTVLLCVLFSLKTKMLKNHKQRQQQQHHDYGAVLLLLLLLSHFHELFLLQYIQFSMPVPLCCAFRVVML